VVLDECLHRAQRERTFLGRRRERVARKQEGELVRGDEERDGREEAREGEVVCAGRATGQG